MTDNVLCEWTKSLENGGLLASELEYARVLMFFGVSKVTYIVFNKMKGVWMGGMCDMKRVTTRAF
jgi:hypothetical protein